MTIGQKQSIYAQLIKLHKNDREIAKACKVSDQTVALRRKERVRVQTKYFYSLYNFFYSKHEMLLKNLEELGRKHTDN